MSTNAELAALILSEHTRADDRWIKPSHRGPMWSPRDYCDACDRDWPCPYVEAARALDTAT